MTLSYFATVAFVIASGSSVAAFGMRKEASRSETPSREAASPGAPTTPHPSRSPPLRARSCPRSSRARAPRRGTARTRARRAARRPPRNPRTPRRRRRSARARAFRCRRREIATDALAARRKPRLTRAEPSRRTRARGLGFAIAAHAPIAPSAPTAVSTARHRVSSRRRAARPRGPASNDPGDADAYASSVSRACARSMGVRSSASDAGARVCAASDAACVSISDPTGRAPERARARVDLAWRARQHRVSSTQKYACAFRSPTDHRWFQTPFEPSHARFNTRPFRSIPGVER